MKLTLCLLACFVYACSCQNFGDFMTEIRQAKVRDRETEKLEETTGIVTKLKQIFKEESLTDSAEKLLDNEFEQYNPYEVGSLCLNHTKYLLQGIKDQENWALRMVDSIGKPSSDLLDFHIRWIGNYEECTAVEAIVYDDPVNKTGPSNPYNGKYCLTYFPIGGDQQPTLLQPTGLALAIGMCFPDTCSSLEAGALALTLVRSLPLNTSFVPYAYAVCQEKDLEYSDKAIAVIVVCSIFLVIIVIATAYDVTIQVLLPYVSQMNKVEPSNHMYGTFSSKQENGHVHQSNGHISNSGIISEKSPLNRDSYDHAVETKIHDEREPDMTYKPGLPGRLLLSFSAYTNASKIFNTNQASGILTSVNGIRFISMTWVVLGHTYAFGLNATDNISTFLPQILKRFSFQVISNATVAVDTFFVLSGLLVAYLSLREMKKKNGAKRFSWGMFYFHRFWRLTPPYMLFLMFYVPTMKYWTTGPLWPQSTGFEQDECKDTWWKNILYVNNIIEPEKMCMAWSWYLSNDMQFYVISPLMLIPLYYSPLWGTITCLAFVLSNFIATGVISKQHKLGSNMILGDSSNEAFTLIYVKPWCRIAPYVVGLFTGYILYKTDCKVKMSKFVNMLGWAIATAFALLVLYGLYDSEGTEKLGVDAAALYNATGRTAWGMAVAWVIFACATGYGGPVNALLSWRAIIPLSRLTYCAYLVHPVIMYLYYFSRRTLMRWYDLEISYLFLGNICLTYAVAFVISLAFESPMMGLEKALLGREKRS
ncbi:nose resistant to fluoxetine protein 6-like [Mercenaria mercenaria]|uniref:nose resistant to fluoxetine protein 6-like n=1 Tax=Mercenaria mercenaria TaxID=6596 RepID=UPI00234E4E4C|nr:nose resistant to fluoxetine protein 6-like [Mercenaria mercenaria]